MEQNKITKRTALLDEKGNIANPGYCVRSLYDYDRSKITANPTRIKEWDFYQISNERYVFQIVLADISIGGAGFFTAFDMATGERVEHMNLSLLTFGRLGLEENNEVPHTLRNRRGKFDLQIKSGKTKKILTVKLPGKIDACIELDVMPELESLVMAVPFEKDGQFYLNQKMNCMPAKGYVKAGKIDTELNPETTFCVLDWGRGVWPYAVSWYWGNGTVLLPEGKLFGFEIGWGFGDMSAFTENTLFYDGKAHKIGTVSLTKDEKDWMKPWVFTSDDGRFEMTMTPVFDNYTSSRVAVAGNRCHQVFGTWAGYAVLDDGTKIELNNNMTAFCEFSDNLW